MNQLHRFWAGEFEWVSLNAPMTNNYRNNLHEMLQCALNFPAYFLRFICNNFNTFVTIFAHQDLVDTKTRAGNSSVIPINELPSSVLDTACVLRQDEAACKQ